MTSLQELIEAVHASGVTIRVEGSDLKIRPAGLLPPELKIRLREHKPDLLLLLQPKHANETPYTDAELSDFPRQPFTDVEVRETARRGVKRAVVVVPSFVTDCLETLEEIALRASTDWHAHGGHTLRLVPSLNDRDSWADAVVTIARETSSWLA